MKNQAQKVTAESTVVATTTEAKPEITIVRPKDGIYDIVNIRRDKLLPFLNGNHMLFEKLARSFSLEINTNEKLRSCSQPSMIQAFYKCCEYGLDPAASLGQAWMIPYGGKIDFQIGYRGWLKLLYNNPMVTNILNYAVHEGDEFAYELGMNPNIKHVPAQGSQTKDKLIATYGIVKFTNGESQIKVCWRDEIDESKAASRSGNRSDSPWNKYFESMALIVPIRKMGRNLGLPLKIEDYDENYTKQATEAVEVA